MSIIGNFVGKERKKDNSDGKNSSGDERDPDYMMVDKTMLDKWDHSSKDEDSPDDSQGWDINEAQVFRELT